MARSTKRRGRRPRHICIYLITCNKNGRVYIGSSKDTCMRWNSHIWDLLNWKHCNPDLMIDWKKYGYSSFSFSILEIIDGDDNSINIRSLEQKWINKFVNPYNRRSSYAKDKC
jgi:group I intron endonuclease